MKALFYFGLISFTVAVFVILSFGCVCMSKARYDVDLKLAQSEGQRTAQTAELQRRRIRCGR